MQSPGFKPQHLQNLQVKTGNPPSLNRFTFKLSVCWDSLFCTSTKALDLKTKPKHFLICFLMCKGRPEGWQELTFSFHRVGPRDQSEVTSLGSKHLDLLSHHRLAFDFLRGVCLAGERWYLNLGFCLLTLLVYFEARSHVAQASCPSCLHSSDGVGQHT